MKKKSLFKLRLGLTILFVTLGLWQTYRWHTKTQWISTMQSRMAMDPVDIHQMLNIPKDERTYRRVTITGIVNPAYALDIGPRTAVSRVGYDRLVPLEIIVQDKPLWIPLMVGFLRKGTIASWPKDQVTVVGMVRKKPCKTLFAPDIRPMQAQWIWLDMLALPKAWPNNVWTDNYVELIDPPKPYEKAVSAPFPPNNHMWYMLTWFSLAVVIWFVGRRPRVV